MTQDEFADFSVANAISAAAGVRLTEIPMSPPVVLKAMESNGKGR